MRRIFLLPFIGRVLCHIDWQNAVSNFNLYCLPNIAPRGRNLNAVQAISAQRNLGRRQIDHDNSMAKCPFLHQISCRVNQQAQLSFNRNWGDELCPAGKELSKRAKRYCRQSWEIEFTSDFGHFNPSLRRSTSVIPIWKHLRLPGPSVPCAFLKSRQTWRWRGRGKVAEFGQYGRRPSQSARGSCLPEFL
jgi:hypothetical protein